jgi:hypothetical protein
MAFTPRQLQALEESISNILVLDEELKDLSKDYLLRILNIHIRIATSTLDNWEVQEYYGHEERDHGELERAIGGLRSCESWLNKTNHDVIEDYNEFEIMGLLIENITTVVSVSTRVITSRKAVKFRTKSNGASGGKNSGIARGTRAEQEWKPKARRFAQEIWASGSAPTLTRTAGRMETGWRERYGEDAPRGYDTFLIFVRGMASAGELPAPPIKKIARPRAMKRLR